MRIHQISLALLMCFVLATNVEAGGCSDVQGRAGSFLGHECGCINTECSCPIVSADSTFVLATCTNGCEYCTSDNSVCVTYSTHAASYDKIVAGVLFTDYDTGYSSYYTRGPRSGTEISFVCTEDCTTLINGQECYNTKVVLCSDGVSTNYYIDCSNVEAGAVINLCESLHDIPSDSSNYLLNALILPEVVNLTCDSTATSSLEEGPGSSLSSIGTNVSTSGSPHSSNGTDVVDLMANLPAGTSTQASTNGADHPYFQQLATLIVALPILAVYVAL